MDGWIALEVLFCVSTMVWHLLQHPAELALFVRCSLHFVMGFAGSVYVCVASQSSGCWQVCIHKESLFPPAVEHAGV